MIMRNWTDDVCRGTNNLLLETKMLTEASARDLASHWSRAWNAHDLDEIMSHYAEDVVLVSPVAARILNDPSGTVKGKDALRAYFKKGLDVYPSLKFELLDVLWGVSSVVLYYTNQKGAKTGEFMEIDSQGKVVRVVANYND
jgi:ketosteroid isomerase-like protein